VYARIANVEQTQLIGLACGFSGEMTKRQTDQQFSAESINIKTKSSQIVVTF
jgi:hypothetical protein